MGSACETSKMSSTAPADFRADRQTGNSPAAALGDFRDRIATLELQLIGVRQRLYGATPCLDNVKKGLVLALEVFGVAAVTVALCLVPELLFVLGYSLVFAAYWLVVFIVVKRVVEWTSDVVSIT
jgi:hypothetical protein